MKNAVAEMPPRTTRGLSAVAALQLFNPVCALPVTGLRQIPARTQEGNLMQSKVMTPAKVMTPPKETALERFLRYATIDTQSAEGQTSVPSTRKQLDLANLL